MIFSAIKRLKTIFEPNPPEATNYHLHLSGARLASKVQLRQLSVLKHRTTAVVAIRMLLYLIFTLTCWSYVGGWVMALWLAFNVMHTLASMKSADDFFNEPSMDKRFHYWKNRTLQMILVSGLSIGFAGFYFMVPDNVIGHDCGRDIRQCSALRHLASRPLDIRSGNAASDDSEARPDIPAVLVYRFILDAYSFPHYFLLRRPSE